MRFLKVVLAGAQGAQVDELNTSMSGRRTAMLLTTTTCLVTVSLLGSLSA